MSYGFSEKNGFLKSLPTYLKGNRQKKIVQNSCNFLDQFLWLSIFDARYPTLLYFRARLLENNSIFTHDTLPCCFLPPPPPRLCAQKLQEFCTFFYGFPKDPKLFSGTILLKIDHFLKILKFYRRLFLSSLPYLWKK